MMVCLCVYKLQLMIHLGLGKIPEHHIMKRWTKSARDIIGTNVDGSEDTELTFSKSFRHNIMYVSALEMVKMGDAAEDSYRVLMRHITTAKKELREIETVAAPLYYSSGGENAGEARRKNGRTTQLEGLADIGAMTSDGVLIKEPLIRRRRGRPKVTRFKSFLDRGGKKTSTRNSKDAPPHPSGLSQQTTFCKRCRKPGHNSTTCTVDLDPRSAHADEVAPKKPRKKNCCRKCNGLGHNSATCTVDAE